MPDQAPSLLPEQVDIMAATRAALDPDRRRWHSDILVSATLVAATARGSMSLEGLHRSIRRTWATDAITIAAVQAAVDQATAALYLKHTEDNGVQRWEATERLRTEVDEDRRWVSEQLRQFRDDVRTELEAEHEIVLPEDRATNAASVLMQALVMGASHSYSGENVSPVPDISAVVDFDKEFLRDYLRDHIAPASLSHALFGVGLKVIDPVGDLGTEIVRLLLISGVLRLLVTQRTMQVVSLEGVQLALDTSSLVPLVGIDTPQKTLVIDMIEQSVALGAEVVVGQHNLDEWERLWDAAEQDRDVVENKLPGAASRIVNHAFSRAFLEMRKRRPELNWPRFEDEHRNIRKKLEAMGVRVRRHGNSRQADVDLVREMRVELLRLSEDPSYRGRRSYSSADTDAQTAAMVARWRSRSRPDVPSAWFVAEDTLTRTAYEKIRPDDPFPLSVSPWSWLLFLAHVRQASAEDEVRLAQAVGDAAIREEFFAAVATYNYADAIEICRILQSTDTADLTDEEVVSAARIAITEFVADDGADDMRDALEYLRRREDRREQRGSREGRDRHPTAGSSPSERSVTRWETRVAALGLVCTLWILGATIAVVLPSVREGLETASGISELGWRVLGGALAGVGIAAITLSGFVLWKGAVRTQETFVKDSWDTGLVWLGANGAVAVLGAIFIL